jgi:hypothetical protein
MSCAKVNDRVVIRVEGSRLMDEWENVKLVSNLMVMLRCGPKYHVSTSRICIDRLLAIFADVWRKNIDEVSDRSVIDRVEGIQANLIALGALKADDIRGGMQGVLDRATLNAIKRAIPSFEIDKTVIDRRVTVYLARGAGRLGGREEQSSAASSDRM